MNELNDYLRKTALILIRNASFIEPVGLIDGKMGIAIFLYTYARYANKKIYSEYADELMDEILQSISSGLPLNTNSGIPGIGIGLDYLARNQFIEIDPKETLQDIDSLIRKQEACLPKASLDLIYPNSIAYWNNRHNQEETHNRTSVLFSRLTTIYRANPSVPLAKESLVHILFMLKTCLDQHIIFDNALLLHKNIFSTLRLHDNAPALALHIWNILFPEKKIEKNFTLSLNDLIALAHLQFIYNPDIPARSYYEHIPSSIPERNVLLNILHCANLQNLGLKYNLTGTAWFLLNYLQSIPSRS